MNWTQKQILTCFLFFLLPFFASKLAFGRIQEIKSFQEIKTSAPFYNEKTAWLVFDLDNTLVAPSSVLGSNTWFYYLVDMLKCVGLDHEDAQYFSVQIWNRVQAKISFKLTESWLPDWIQEQQKKGLKTLGLTSRHLQGAAKTFEQLKQFKINFNAAAVSPREIYFSKEQLHSTEDALLKESIFFVGNHNHKGRAFVALLKELKARPSEVVFVDDRREHVDGMEEELKKIQLPFYGFRYSRLDADPSLNNKIKAENCIIKSP